MNNKAPKVKSADRVFDILELFAGEQEAYTMTDIATHLNMPASSAYMLVQNMLARGYLETDSSGKLIRMGYKIFEIRSRYMRNTSLIKEFYRVADKISGHVNETIFLAVRGGDQLVYIAEKQISTPLRFANQFGHTLPLYASASGKVLLGNCTDDEIRSLYPSGALKPLTPHTVSTVDALLVQVEQARRDGLAFNKGETVADVQCAAGAIFDSEGAIVASLSISIPSIRLSAELWERAQQWVRQGCRELSYRVYRQS